MSNKWERRASDAAQSSAAEAMTILDLWLIVSGRRTLMVKVTVVFFLLALVSAVTSQKQYTATGEIQIQKDSSDTLGLDELMGGAAAGGSDALDATVTLQTQAKILESQTLALRVIEKLDLEHTPDFVSKPSMMGKITGMFSPKEKGDPVAASLENSPRRRDHVLAVFKSNTKIAPVAGTRLVDVSYTNSDPKLAAIVVNELVRSLADYGFEMRSAATTETEDWLSKQLTDLKLSSQQLQDQVAELQRKSGIITIGGEDGGGKTSVYSPVLDRLEQTTTTLTAAETNRVLKGALYEAAKSGDPEMIAGLSAVATAPGASPAVGTSIALIQALRTQEASQKAALSAATTKFGSAYPKLDEMRANLASVQDSIREEQNRLTKQTFSDYQIAQQVEQNTRASFENQKITAEETNDKAIQYEMLRKEADQSRDLYQRLLGKLREAGVLNGLKSSNISVVEPGRVPSNPSKPKTTMLLGGSIFLGLFLSAIAAFVLEVMDDTVHDHKAAVRKYQGSLIGELPAPSSSGHTKNEQLEQLLPGLEPNNAAYREVIIGIRTTILFPSSGGTPKLILITSPNGGEGKSSLAAHLAIRLANHGRRVLLIDTGLRNPTLHEKFGISNDTGLTTLLTQDPDTALNDAVIHTIPSVPRLAFIAAGPTHTDTASLLGSDRLTDELARWKEEYDFVIFKGTSILSYTDSLPLAHIADQVIIVARYATTKNADIDRTIDRLLAHCSRSAIKIVVKGINKEALRAARLPWRWFKKDKKAAATPPSRWATAAKKIAAIRPWRWFGGVKKLASAITSRFAKKDKKPNA